MKKEAYNVAVVGATGAVGEEMLKVLAERDFPVAALKPLASSRSAGSTVEFRGKEYLVEELTDDSFADIDIALFSAGGSVSTRFAPSAASSGAVVVDNTNAFRMEPDIPLVVPEVNPHAIAGYRNRGIIANPNCSTIQMVVALKPIYDAAGIKRVVVSTYQAVSGSGKKAIRELEQQILSIYQQHEMPIEVYPHQIAFNCLPHIDVFLDNDYTREEMKMVNETKKIMEDDRIMVTATTVRVPVFYGHSESVNVETKKKISAEEIKVLLSKAPGVVVVNIDKTATAIRTAVTQASQQAACQ